MGFPRPQETTYRYLTGDKRIAYDSWRPATANLSNTPVSRFEKDATLK